MTPSGTFTYRYRRLDRPEDVFTEGLLDANDERVLTYSTIPSPYRERLSASFERRGWVKPGEVVSAVRKHLFFHRHFTIVEFLYPGDTLIGTYCDIAMPLEPYGGEFYILDLYLDLWIWPDGRYEVWDRDELQAALATGTISAGMAALAEEKLATLIAEVEAGRFPKDYLA